MICNVSIKKKKRKKEKEREEPILADKQVRETKEQIHITDHRSLLLLSLTKLKLHGNEHHFSPLRIKT